MRNEAVVLFTGEKEKMMTPIWFMVAVCVLLAITAFVIQTLACREMRRQLDEQEKEEAQTIKYWCTQCRRVYTEADLQATGGVCSCGARVEPSPLAGYRRVVHRNCSDAAASSDRRSTCRRGCCRIVRRRSITSTLSEHASGGQTNQDANEDSSRAS